MDPNLLNEIHSATNTLSKVQKINVDDVELKEELYIGNLHHQSRHHRNNHCWTMFISKSPTDVVPPITIKCVTYHLHQTFRPNIVMNHHFILPVEDGIFRTKAETHPNLHIVLLSTVLGWHIYFCCCHATWTCIKFTVLRHPCAEWYIYIYVNFCYSFLHWF